MRGQDFSGNIWYRWAGIPSSPGEDCGSSRSSAVSTMSPLGSCQSRGRVVLHLSGGSQPLMYLWQSATPLSGDCITDFQWVLRALPMFKNRGGGGGVPSTPYPGISTTPPAGALKCGYAQYSSAWSSMVTSHTKGGIDCAVALLRRLGVNGTELNKYVIWKKWAGQQC